MNDSLFTKEDIEFAKILKDLSIKHGYCLSASFHRNVDRSYPALDNDINYLYITFDKSNGFKAELSQSKKIVEEILL